MQGQAFDLEGLQVEVYQQAQSLEQQSRDFYRDKAREAQKRSHKELFLRLADEEQRHFFLLDHMIEFVNRPRNWLTASGVSGTSGMASRVARTCWACWASWA